MTSLRLSKYLHLLVLLAASFPPSAVMAQDVPAPPPPVSGPGDPPLLPPPGQQTPMQPSTPNEVAPPPPPGQLKIRPTNPSVQPPSVAAPETGADAPLLTAVEPLNGLAAIPSDRLTASPELVIDAGGFLGSVGCVAVSPDSKLIAATGDKVIRIIDAETGNVQKTLRGDRLRTSYGNTNGVQFSPDGQFLVVGIHDDGAHGSVRLYKTNNFDVIHQLLPGMDSACLHVEFSRDGKFLVTVDRDGQIIIWDWPGRRILKRLPARDPSRPIIDSLHFASAEPYLLSIEHDGPHVYRVPDGAEISANDYMPPRLLAWMYDILQKKVTWPFTMTNSPRAFAAQMEKELWGAAGIGSSSGGSKPWVALWKTRTGTNNPSQTQAKVVYEGHRWEVFTFAISPNQKFVVSGDKFGEVHIWDAASGKTLHKVVSQGKSVYEAAFTDSNQQIVFATKPDLSNWGFNSYGASDHVLDLRQRVIRRQAPNALPKNDEVTSVNGGTASLQAPGAGQQSYHVVYKGRGAQQKYRIPSGRIPSCYTVLDSAKLGVNEPVLFADNLGFLGMWDSSGDELRRAYRGHESMVTSISPAKNGKIYVTGSTDRTIRIWSLLNHKATGIFDFKYENAAVIKVNPGSSSASAGVQVGDSIVSVDGHSLDRVYEMMLYNSFEYKPGQTVPVVMKRGEREFGYQMKLNEGFDYVEPLLNVFIGDNNQWIIWTPKGYYDCSPGADQLIGWHVNQGPKQASKFFKAQQFRKQLYRPDVINQIIETGVVSEAETLANGKLPNTPPPLDLHDRDSFAKNQPPQVTIESPADDETYDDPRVTIDATAVSKNGLPIGRITLLHNGTPARVFRPSGKDESLKFELSHRLRLFPGRNEIAFVAENSAATSDADDCRITLNSPATEQKSRVYVLSIGIAEYANAGRDLENLKFAAQDATAFAEAVKNHSDGRLYSSVESKVLLNSEADRGSILDGLQWLVDNVKAGDAVMLFCSGHGFLDDRNNFYLSTHEVDPAKLRSTAVSWREVVGILHEDLPACQRMVFLDACHADGIGSDSQNPLQDLAAPELGTMFYASCTMQQKSFENDEWKHGAFTKAILDLLNDRNADVFPSTGDGLVSAVELGLGVVDKVSTMTGDRQNPVVYSPTRLRRLNVLEFQK